MLRLGILELRMLGGKRDVVALSIPRSWNLHLQVEWDATAGMGQQQSPHCISQRSPWSVHEYPITRLSLDWIPFSFACYAAYCGHWLGQQHLCGELVRLIRLLLLNVVGSFVVPISPYLARVTL